MCGFPFGFIFNFPTNNNYYEIPALIYLSLDEKKQLSEDAIDDFFEYTRGKKIPPEGIPGFDFSDPESIVEFTK